MRTRSQSKRTNDFKPPRSGITCQKTELLTRLPQIQRKAKPVKNAKGKRPLAPKAWKITPNLLWETHSGDIIRIARDEIARAELTGLAAMTPGQRRGPFLCQCCWKKCRGSYELRRHYGTHLLDKIFKCGDKSCSYRSAQKDNLRTHCRKLHHVFGY